MKFTFSRKSVIVTPLVLLSFFVIGHSNSQDADKQLSVTDDLFKCLTEMTKSSVGDFLSITYWGIFRPPWRLPTPKMGGAILLDL